MNNLCDYINEALSQENIKRLTDYINDGNIDEYLKIIKKHAKSSGVDIEAYNKFFDKHGISQLNWGRNNSAAKQFTSIFNEYEHIDILTNIIKNDGVVSINDIKNTGNIFLDYCKEWEEEAKTIASWTNSKSANAGPCEMLLKFIVKEGTTGNVGDVTIEREGQEEMEVKSATLKGNSGSGGHAAGQKGTIRKTWAVYHYLNTHLLHIESSNAIADKCAYFQNEAGVNDFNDKLKAANCSKEDIAKGIVDALCFQYDFISNEENAKNTLKTIDELYKSAIAAIKYNNKFEKQDLLNLVGCIQLYLYSQIEEFDYFFCVLLDKNIENENPSNGFYILFKECKKPNTTLLNFNTVLDHLYFGVLDSTKSSQGRTGKIYIRK